MFPTSLRQRFSELVLSEGMMMMHQPGVSMENENSVISVSTDLIIQSDDISTTLASTELSVQTSEVTTTSMSTELPVHSELASTGRNPASTDLSHQTSEAQTELISTDFPVYAELASTGANLASPELPEASTNSTSNDLQLHDGVALTSTLSVLTDLPSRRNDTFTDVVSSELSIKSETISKSSVSVPKDSTVQLSRASASLKLLSTDSSVQRQEVSTSMQTLPTQSSIVPQDVPTISGSVTLKQLLTQSISKAYTTNTPTLALEEASSNTRKFTTQSSMIVSQNVPTISVSVAWKQLFTQSISKAYTISNPTLALQEVSTSTQKSTTHSSMIVSQDVQTSSVSVSLKQLFTQSLSKAYTTNTLTPTLQEVSTSRQTSTTHSTVVPREVPTTLTSVIWTQRFTENLPNTHTTNTRFGHPKNGH